MSRAADCLRHRERETPAIAAGQRWVLRDRDRLQIVLGILAPLITAWFSRQREFARIAVGAMLAEGTDDWRAPAPAGQP